MMGIAGVDQAELQKAIDAARAAAASGRPATPDTGKKGGRRTMLGVVAPPLVAPKTAPAPVEDGNGWDSDPKAPAATPSAQAAAPRAPSAAPPKADPLDDGWGFSDEVVPLVARAAPRAATGPAQEPAPPAAGAGGPRGTVLLGSMAQTSSPAQAPTAGGSSAAAGPPRGTVMLGSLTSSPGPATGARPAPPSEDLPRATVAFGAAPAAGGVAVQPEPRLEAGAAQAAGGAEPPRPASRGTMLLASAPQGQPAPAAAPAAVAVAPARPTTGSREEPRPTRPPEPDGDEATRDTEPPPAVPAKAPQAVATRSVEPAQLTGLEIPGSSADPLADTIAPGSLKFDDLVPRTAMQPAEIPKTTTQPQAPTLSASGTHGAISPTQSSASVKKAATTTSPPFLASKALQEDIAPTEPGRGWMRALAIGLGAALVGLWAAPVSLRPLAFAWTAALEAQGAARAMALFTPAAGILLLLLGLVPVPYVVRAAFAFILGAAPLVAGTVGLGPIGADRGWTAVLIAAATILLPGALIHRANYRASLLSRIAVALGILLALGWALVPGGSGMTRQIVDGLAGGALGMATSVWNIGLFVLCALSLLAFMSSASTGGCGTVGRVMVLWKPGLALLAGLAAVRSSGELLGLGVAAATLLTYGALASYGLAQVLAWFSTAGEKAR
ncbi:MAG: hypothetical protein HYY06_11865 [Deltaproteobacteria bacterium]|nr:hypothetical protein [Deltaproteobacteria bacterium]